MAKACSTRIASNSVRTSTILGIRSASWDVGNHPVIPATTPNYQNRELHPPPWQWTTARTIGISGRGAAADGAIQTSSQWNRRAAATGTAQTQDLGSCTERCAGSTPASRILKHTL